MSQECTSIQERSFLFAERILKLHLHIEKHHHELRNLSWQLLKSGSSIGANSEEAIAAESPADYLHKMSISHKEARETHYWLRLLETTNLLPTKSLNELLEEANSLVKILCSTTKSLKAKQTKKNSS